MRVGHLDDFGGDHFAGAAPGGHAVEDHEAGGGEGGVEVGFAVGGGGLVDGGFLEERVGEGGSGFCRD